MLFDVVCFCFFYSQESFNWEKSELSSDGESTRCPFLGPKMDAVPRRIVEVWQVLLGYRGHPLLPVCCSAKDLSSCLEALNDAPKGGGAKRSQRKRIFFVRPKMPGEQVSIWFWGCCKSSLSKQTRVVWNLQDMLQPLGNWSGCFDLVLLPIVPYLLPWGEAGCPLLVAPEFVEGCWPRLGVHFVDPPQIITQDAYSWLHDLRISKLSAGVWVFQCELGPVWSSWALIEPSTHMTVIYHFTLTSHITKWNMVSSQCSLVYCNKGTVRFKAHLASACQVKVYVRSARSRGAVDSSGADCRQRLFCWRIPVPTGRTSRDSKNIANPVFEVKLIFLFSLSLNPQDSDWN